jgi:hypothetical protein
MKWYLPLRVRRLCVNSVIIFSSTSRTENKMQGHLFALSPSCASLNGGYAHLATPWQKLIKV